MDELKFTEGCTCYNLIINGNNCNDISLEKKKDICIRLMQEYYNDSDWDNELISLCQQFGEMNFQFHCDQCGDDVYEYTLKI